MKIKNIFIKSRQLIPALLISPVLYASDVSVVGSQTVSFQIPNPTHSATIEKKIQLLKVELSKNKKTLLKQASTLNHFKTYQASTNYPTKKELGMENVPVLDQGIHGTCTTFAITAVIDAALKKGDYISQLCILELSNYLHRTAWNGSYADFILGIIENYGVIDTYNQKRYGCGGMKEYPAYTTHNPNTSISTTEYTSRSELIYPKSISWSTISPSLQQDDMVNAVKEALLAGDRVSISMLIPDVNLGTVGAVARHKNWFFEDTWVLTPEILKIAHQADSAHRIIVTGYDDDAIAKDKNGDKHKGLFTLRNSWGTSAGNNGDFYMSYDYFKLLCYKLIITHANQ